MKFSAIAFFVFLPVIGWGQSFESVVDFRLELSSLADPEAANSAAGAGKIAILEGLMADSTITESPAETQVWVELVGGAWIGTAEVRSYSCRILFRGEAWTEVFPGSKPRDPSPGYVPQGSRLLIAARIIGYDAINQAPLAEMIDFRVLN